MEGNPDRKPRTSQEIVTRMAQNAQSLDAISGRLYSVCQRLGVAVPPTEPEVPSETVRDDTFLTGLREHAAQMEGLIRIIDHHLTTLEDFV